jgi:hypothetical protein
MITRLAQRTPAGETPDQRARREETEKQRQVAVAQPLHLGVFDQTPTSFSSMMLSTVTSETGSGNFLMSTSSIVARRRFVMVRAIRRSDTPKDRIALEDFTRTWVKAIIAANP